MKFRDLTGLRFGRLTVMERAKNRNGRVQWRCFCDCGNHTDVPAGHLCTGNTSSCGCLGTENRIKHGKSRTRLYKVWSGMKSRCANPAHKSFHHYGGRGIEVCAEWRDSFGAFSTWARETGYQRGLTIERIDVDGGYCPTNCTWIPKSEQSSNTRHCVFLTFNGEIRTMKGWAQKLGIPYGQLKTRITELGWSAERALTTPPQKRGRSGESNPRAKLTLQQVRAIRTRYAAGGVSQTALAVEYGVSQSRVSALVGGKSWIASVGA